MPGTWKRSGSTLTFTPATPFEPNTAFRVHFRAGHLGLRSAAGGLLASPVVDHLRTKGWSNLRLKQVLAQLGYLPLKWKPTDATAPQPDNLATELAAVYAPPAGSFSWKGGYPKILTTFWGGPSSLIMDGAIRAFQSNEGLTMTGVVTWDLWQHLLKAAAKGQTNPNGYTYAVASEGSPETLTVWHDGHVVMHTLANTGIPAAPTALGTSPVYLRYRFQIMRGTNPDGTKYADPVSWVSYFSAGEAVHYFPRGSYGFPQSLGCVELPYTQAAAGMAVHDLRDAGHRRRLTGRNGDIEARPRPRLDSIRKVRAPARQTTTREPPCLPSCHCTSSSPDASMR